MILLDTNVISELMRPEPHPAVVSWLVAQPRDTLCTASVVQTEILYGIAVLPEGKRKAGLASSAAAMFAEDFGSRILAYDSDAARHYAEIVMDRRGAGSPIETFDAMIAATARAAGAAVATRDTSGFAGCGIKLIDPWTGAREGRG